MSDTIPIRVRAFASLRQALGTADLHLDMPPDATVAQVLARLSADHPSAAPLVSRAIVAVNRDYVEPDHALSPGDEVAVFPPVSGGTSDAPLTYVALSPAPIEAQAVSAMVTEPGAGAVVTFAGVVREHNQGRPVRYLEYEAYPEMAEAKLRQIVAQARQRWPLIRGVAVVHRLGRLEIGELAVLVAIGAAHRNDGAFQAARYLIDRIKEIVPIWKKEVWVDGEAWLEGDYLPRPGE